MKPAAKLYFERLLLALLGCLFSATLTWFDLAQPLDHLFYDVFNEAAPLAPAPDVVIVAIDEDSLRELGRWPWPRENHVELLRRLHAQGVSAVAMDILFAEPYHDYPEVDDLLAAELRQLQRTVLPVFIGRTRQDDRLREMLPVAPLAAAAGAIGHVHIEVDADGVARQVYLREGLGAARWPHFTVALAELLAQAPNPLPGVSDQAVLEDPDPRAIIRSHANFIPFMGGAGSVAQVSYADVMKGRLAPGLLRDKIVFVGATAAGHVDNIATSLGQISGVEVNANIFQALRSGRLARPLHKAPATLLGAAVIALTIFGFTRLRPGHLLAAVLGGVLLLSLASYLLLRAANLWVSPAPVLLTLLLAYPLWNWLRLAAAMDFIQRHLLQLDQENRQSFFPDSGRTRPGATSSDPVDAILQQLDAAYSQSRQHHQLVRDTLAQLSSGVLLAEPGGTLLFVNDEARKLLAITGSEWTLERALAACEAVGRTTLQELLAGLSRCGEHFNVEGVSRASGHDLLLQGGLVGPERALLLLVLTDVTQLKHAEKRRAEALNFLSHDLRAPLTSVLALIEGYRDRPGATDPRLLQQIEKYIRANLSYAENFIQLARLEQAAQPRFDECEAQSLVDNAVAQLFHMAASRGIGLRVSDQGDDIWLRCSRELVERVLINLIDNALKHSDRGATVTVGVDLDEGAALFTVRDQGEGIAEDDLQRIFAEYQQGANARSGAGLGLRFVAAVAQAHGGSVEAANDPAGGCVFTLRLPLGNA